METERGAELVADAVLFDFDGVLVDSTAAVEAAWTRWAGEVGLPLAEVMAVAHGRRTADTVAAVAPALDAAAEAARIEAREVDAAETIRSFAAAADLLAAVPHGRWVIVTSGSRALATARLHAVGLPAPVAMVTGDDVTAGKPAPDAYLAGAAALGADPAACVVVEDAPAGVEAARRAGMRVIAVATTHRPEELSGAEFVVAGLGDLDIAVTDGGPLVVRTR